MGKLIKKGQGGEWLVSECSRRKHENFQLQESQKSVPSAGETFLKAKELSLPSVKGMHNKGIKGLC